MVMYIETHNYIVLIIIDIIEERRTDNLPDILKFIWVWAEN